MVDAGLLARTDQREADAIAATTAEPCAPRSAGRINDWTKDLLVKCCGLFYVRNVDEDVVDAGRAEQRFALGGDRRRHRGFAEVAPGVFGPELNELRGTGCSFDPARAWWPPDRNSLCRDRSG